MKTSCIILAAGASTRMGGPKQLARIAGETLLERTARIAADAGCKPVLVVLGAKADAILSGCRLRNAEIVHNPEWTEGMSSSIRTGVQALAARTGTLLLMTCDQPAVTAQHLCALASQCVADGSPVASFYAGRNGVPACFPASMFPQLLALQGDRGARELLVAARAIPLAYGDLDVDTPESLERARRLVEDNVRT